MSDTDELDIVFGASSAIGGALIQRWQGEGLRPILAVTRSANAISDIADLNRVQVETSDYTEAGLSALAARLVSAQTNVTRLVVCNGVLQGDAYRPERALTQIDSAAMYTVFEVNTFLPHAGAIGDGSTIKNECCAHCGRVIGARGQSG